MQKRANADKQKINFPLWSVVSESYHTVLSVLTLTRPPHTECTYRIVRTYAIFRLNKYEICVLWQWFVFGAKTLLCSWICIRLFAKMFPRIQGLVSFCICFIFIFNLFQNTTDSTSCTLLTINDEVLLWRCIFTSWYFCLIIKRKQLSITNLEINLMITLKERH